jgi:acyl dehydratase
MAGEPLSMTAYFGRVRKHAKGWTFCINIEFYNDGEVVWSSQSHYLSRTKHNQLQSSDRVRDNQIGSEYIKVTEHLSSRLGRQYAKVSGDFNPIHLTKLSAKLFGLKSHIIHGMWTKAFCLSKLQSSGQADFTRPFDVNVEFKQPLYLPNEIGCCIQQQHTEPTNQHIAFNVQSVKQSSTYQHLLGTIKTI